MKPSAIYLAVLLVAVALFLALPQLDLATSYLFYSETHGFLLKDWPPVELLYKSIPWISGLIISIIVVGSVWLILVERPLWRLDRKALLFLALSTGLGPGLIVNTVLKDHWGRARPIQVESFGGTQHFTPAPVPSTECRRNCSFPSGHAALGFALVAFALLLPPGAGRRCGIAAAIGFGLLVGLARIAQGAHFLSDVVFAGLLVYGMTAMLYRWVVVEDGLATPMLLRLYRTAGRAAAAGLAPARRLWMSPAARLGAGTAVVAVLVVVSIESVDRPLAVFFHVQSADIHALFGLIGRLGLGYGWLTGFGFGFVALHWGGRLPRLRPFDRRLRSWAPIPAFLFAAIAASGIATDVLKVVCGRTRPELLFDTGLYRFGGFAWHADHWSFPSGHTATIVSLATALWHLWPSHLLFYATVAITVSASRVVVGAHYLSDTIAGAWLAVLTTRGVVLVFARAGVDVAARNWRLPAEGEPPRVCRRLGGIAWVRGPPRPRVNPAAGLHRRQRL